MVEEQIFFNENGVLVTNTRFQMQGQMFAMAGVTSVGVTYEEPSKNGPIAMGLLGVGLFAVEFYLYGVIFLLIAGLWFWGLRTEYHPTLTTAAGQQRVTSSKDEEFMASLRQALTNAIIHRG